MAGFGINKAMSQPAVSTKALVGTDRQPPTLGGVNRVITHVTAPCLDRGDGNHHRRPASDESSTRWKTNGLTGGFFLRKQNNGLRASWICLIED